MVDKNYWPYWNFRDAAGNRVRTAVVQVPVHPAMALASVTLGSNGNLHLFALSVMR